MVNIPLRPFNTNFWGVFIQTQSFYPSFNFNTQIKPQIDVLKSLGANLIVYQGDVNWVGTGSITQTQYLSYRKQIQDYLQSINMYSLCIEALTHSLWGSVSNAQAVVVMQAVARLLANYPGVIGCITEDEPFFGGDTSGPVVTNLTSQYNAVKAILPSNIPVCACPNPNVNYPYPTLVGYSGQQATNINSVAAICDFIAFFPFQTVSFSDFSAVIAGFPGKQFILASAVALQNGDVTIPAAVASIMGLEGVHPSLFQAFGYFLSTDFDSNTYGMLNSDLSLRTVKTNAFKAGIVGPVGPFRSNRAWPGNPRLSQYQKFGYTA